MLVSYQVSGPLGQAAAVKPAEKIADVLQARSVADVHFRGETYRVFIGYIPKNPGRLRSIINKAYRILAKRGIKVAMVTEPPRVVDVPADQAAVVIG